MSDKPAPITLTFTDEEVERFTSGIADVIQWLHGFRAALPEETSKELPGDWQALRELNIKLRGARNFASIPF